MTVALIRDMQRRRRLGCGRADHRDRHHRRRRRSTCFTGLPEGGTDDYLVWVNDTGNVLGELAPTYDVRDGAPGHPTTAWSPA